MLRDNSKNTIFHLAARFDNTWLIKTLMEALPEELSLASFINDRNKSNNSTPVYEAALFGSYHMLKLFIEHSGEIDTQVDYGWTPLSAAVWGGHFKVVELILTTYQAKLLQRPDLHTAEERNRAMYKFINHRTVDGETALWWAVQVLDPMCKPDSQAHYQKLEEIVFLLLEHGADINIASNDGLTPFHVIAMYGLCNIAERLMKNHFLLFELPSTAYQERAIHHAAIYNREGMIKFLVENKADIHAVNAGGRTAFDLTTNDNIRKFLIAHGYNHKPRDHNYKPRSGKTTPVQQHAAQALTSIPKLSAVPPLRTPG